MEIYFKEVTSDELVQELANIFTQMCDDPEFRFEIEDNDEKQERHCDCKTEKRNKPENKARVKYCYSNNTAGSDYDIDKLKKLLSDKYGEIAKLKSDIEVLKSSHKDMSESQANVSKNIKAVKDAMETMLCEDVEELESKLRLCIDKAKKFGLDNEKFMETVKTLFKTSGDYIVSSFMRDGSEMKML